MISTLSFNNVSMAVNKKHRKTYQVLHELINTTNAQDGQKMILYSDGERLFVRETEEFKEKFEY